MSEIKEQLDRIEKMLAEVMCIQREQLITKEIEIFHDTVDGTAISGDLYKRLCERKDQRIQDIRSGKIKATDLLML